ncbi:hypothetical protein PSEUBRA_003519 [Kalmanozyma brasiliensis GHG001]|uniref:uncharacterized protein n=1 Tax=Kalmanozyma brasiliensis (strain GHG001) TaxID=1365824 RepID=UPI002868133A|nr:uncharacterized protein PSEUBRA_003519 [Kalmanozyma brasiliensis GHG001]KAF6767260.1 hypothetical protein PSEUBRA_003519 [Kalmanozyma brasiliensis GHG001]
MRFTTPLLTSLLLGLTLTHSALASPAASSKPNEDLKFIKRSHHSHHSSPPSSRGGGMFGSSSGSMLRTVAGGTALAGGAVFAGTAGGIAAHHLFDDHERDESPRREERQEDDRVQQKVPMAQQLGVEGVNANGRVEKGQVYPVAVLMSDGSFRAVPNDNGGGQTVPPPFIQTAPVSGQTGGDQTQTGTGGAAGSGGSGAPFIFPDGN